MNLLLNLAPTGMVPDHSMTPFVPLQPDAIIKDVLSCYALGLTSVHLHARDSTGVPTHRREVYARIIDGIRSQAPDLVLIVSCSGRNRNEFSARSDVLTLQGDLKPDMASLTLSSLNFSGSASVNAPDMVQRLAETMRDNGIKPELEIFDLGMLNYAHYLIDKGILTPPFYFNIMLGNIASAQAKLNHAAALLADLPASSIWTFGGIGSAQQQAHLLALAAGGGVRTGLEDNIWADNGRTQLATNVSMVEKIHGLCNASGKTVMTPAELRGHLALPAIFGA